MILNTTLTQNPHVRVAVETMTMMGLVHVVGEVTTEAYVEIPQIIREKVLTIGCNSSRAGFDGALCGVPASIDQQGPDIAGGVDHALEAREGSARDERDSQGTGNQGIMFGYACNDTPNLMLTPIWLVHRPARRLTQVHHSGEAEGLCPDSRTQVTLAYEERRPAMIDTVLVSTQHDEALLNRVLTDLMTSKVITPVLGECRLKPAHIDISILVNPLGYFVIGGPAGDAGPAGREIIVDTYGGMARHKGGAPPGKDPSRVDCSAVCTTCWATKSVMTAGLASRCELQLVYAIGRAHPAGLYVDISGTGIAENYKIVDTTTEVFDLRPADMVKDLDLLCPIYKEASTYGHFGWGLFPWGAFDRVNALKAAIG